MSDQTQYQRAWQILNQDLRRLEHKQGDLGGALEALYRHQFASGFVCDDLSQVERYPVAHPADPDQAFVVQFNPRRAERFNGRGHSSPGPGQVAEHDGCFLCPGNIYWQQDGLQLGYDVELNGRDYIAWINPYPLAPVHSVIASREHLSQGWAVNGGGGKMLCLADLIMDLVTLARRLPGYLTFYNGIDAGTSIPGHLHYHAFRRPARLARFPIERLTEGCGTAAELVTHGYPVHFAFWRGEKMDVESRASQWARTWIEKNDTRKMELTANIMAAADVETGEVRLYFVPRARSNTTGQSTTHKRLIGGLEMLGELVFSSSNDKRQLDAGQIDYFSLAQMLADVCPQRDGHPLIIPSPTR